MNALLRKEIHLLLPTWLGALALVALPAVVSPVVEIPQSTALLSGGAILALVLALGTFGREFAHGTFSGMMSLPIERRRLWWTKVSVLAAALAGLYGAWWGAFAICAQNWPTLWGLAADMDLTPLSTGLFLLAVFSGGLWTTLFLRQVASAIWFALLIPLLLITVASTIAARFTGEAQPHDAVLTVVLLVYGIAGFWLARWLFLRAEDAHWTGGTIALPDWMSGTRASARTGRRRRPFAALWEKEMALHRPILLMAALLLVLHLGVLALRQAVPDPTKYPIVDIICHSFWGLWLLVPFLLSAASIAEERKLGVLEGQLCLALGWRWQWRVKLLVTVVLGVICGTVPTCLLEDLWRLPNLFASRPGNPSTTIFDGWFGYGVTLASFSGIVMLLGFFASSLSRNTFQALGIGAVTFILGSLFLVVLDFPEHYLGWVLWRGNLGLILGWTGLVVSGLLVARTNFRRAVITRREWTRSLSVVGATALGIVCVAAMIYHRAWELVQNADPLHGPARLSQASRVALQVDPRPVSLGPNGELRTFQFRFNSRSTLLLNRFAVSTGTWSMHSHGSNWISVADDYWDTAAVRADGTLWVSAETQPPIIRLSDPPIPVAPLVQVGTDTNWRQVVRYPISARQRLVLKTDGTLWHWAFNLRDLQESGVDLHTSPLTAATLARVDRISNVESLMTVGPYVYGTSTDGTTWILQLRHPGRPRVETETGLDGIQVELARGNDIRWRSLSGNHPYGLGVKQDGTLWALGNLLGHLPWNRHEVFEQLHPGTNWLSVASADGTAIAVKQDGSLWKLNFGNWRNPPTIVRLGKQSDWITVAAYHDAVYAVAADGGIWKWETHAFRPGWFEISASRIPTRIGSLMD